MKILHSISTSERRLVSLLESEGLKIDSVAGPIAFFAPLDEHSDLWPPAFEFLLEARNRGAYVGVSTRTVFHDDERASASWLMLEPTWIAGYPAAGSLDEFLAASFDLKDWCEECGAGAVQASPVTIRRRPAWKSRSMFALFWMAGVPFLRSERFTSVFRCHGGESSLVCYGKRNSPEASVVQLRAPVEVRLNIPESKAIPCQSCGCLKYGWLRSGPMPAPHSSTAPIVASAQSFGYGANSFKPVFVNAEVYRLALREGMASRDFYPCGPVEYVRNGVLVDVRQ